MFKIKIGLLLIVTIVCFCSCYKKNSHDKSSDGTYMVDEYVVTKGSTLSSKEWKCSEVQNDRVCYPISWKVFEQKKKLFVATINDIDSNSFFAVERFNLLSDSISINKYLKILYSQLYYDTVEIFQNYTLKELSFKNKTSFYGEFGTKIKNVPYTSFAMVFEFDGLLYDLTLKIRKENESNFHEIFQNILYNYQSNSKPVFSEKDELVSFKEVDISKL